MHIRRQRGWEIAERDATAEKHFLSRRQFLGNSALALSAAAIGCGQSAVLKTIPGPRPPYPFRRNPAFTLDRRLSDPAIAATFNNFYEFGAVKDEVWRLTEKFRTSPWTVEVSGLVHKPRTFSVEELIRSMPMEERLYRLRCVEAWAMAVPWTGFPLAALLRLVEPMSHARFVRFVSFNRAEEAPGIKSQSWYDWPYYEGLRLDEAFNKLTMVVTGVYGHELPKQHGAPVRIVVPWKYGYKSPKSIVKIELVAEQPRTFWNEEEPDEYSFLSNVDPSIPHPRWSQATERMIGSFEVRKTTLYNGYAEYVAKLY
jgi:methionine sulfoxide reductase catalytic subunit